MSKNARSVFRAMPSSPPRHAITPGRGRLSVVVPQASENLILNPSINESFFFSALGTNWSPLGVSTITYSREISRRNNGSICVEPTADASAGIYTTGEILQGWNSFSIDLLAGTGATFEIGFMEPSGIVKKSEKVCATGYWQRSGVSYHAPADDSCFLFIRKAQPHTTMCNWYVDGWQHEYAEQPTTFLDGSGDVSWCGRDCFRVGCEQTTGPYSWTGDRFDSTSVRHGLTHAGGAVVPLSEAGFSVSALAGFGGPTPQSVSQPYAQQDGVSYDGFCLPGNQLVISGGFSRCGINSTLHCLRAQMIEAISQPSRSYREPMKLLYQETDKCGNLIGRELEACVSYEGGLEMLLNNCAVEADVDITFQMLDPYWYESSFQTTVYTPIPSDSDQQICVEVCNRGRGASTPPIFQFSGPFEICQICNLDTGNRIDFAEPYPVNYPGLVNINTDPLNTFAVDAMSGQQLDGYIAAGSNLSSFELLPGINTICFTLKNIEAPIQNPLAPLTPFVRVVSRPAYAAVDFAACRNDCDQVVC